MIFLHGELRVNSARRMWFRRSDGGVLLRSKARLIFNFNRQSLTKKNLLNMQPLPAAYDAFFLTDGINRNMSEHGE